MLLKTKSFSFLSLRLVAMKEKERKKASHGMNGM